MAFTPNTLNLSVDTVAGGALRIFFYETQDSRITVLGADYLQNATKRGLRAGDILLIYDNGANETYIANIDSISAAGHGTLVVDEFNISQGVNQPYHTDFWSDAASNSAKTNRLAGRTFFGDAVVNDGIYTDLLGHSDLDWLGLLKDESFNGGDGVGLGNDLDFAKVGVLAEYSGDLAGRSTPLIGLLSAVQAKGCGAVATPRALEGILVNNPTAGNKASGWALYLEAHHLVLDNFNTYGIELDVRNSAGLQLTNPYWAEGRSYGMAIACGAGLDATGQYPGAAAMCISANPVEWASGIQFFSGAVGAHGPDNSKPAIMMPYDHEIQWWVAGGDGHGAVAARLYADASKNFVIETEALVKTVGSFEVPTDKALQFGGSTMYVGRSSVTGHLHFVVGGENTFRLTDDGAVYCIPLDAAPASAAAGYAYFDSSLGWRFYNGSRWNAARRAFGGASVSRDAAQTIGNNSDTAVTWNVESFDTDALHSLLSDTSRMTVPASGVSYVRLNASITFDNNSSGVRRIKIVKNGATTIAAQSIDGAGFDALSVSSGLVAVSASDYFEVFAYQTSGGDLDVLGSQNAFTMEIVE